ncbi:hypothetical protein [Natronospira bacteriovora]|uniref:Uncharacterized protein n=1 Tax=Natronospira bacteriovora TaxID=3069753 RepID=A0ABU0W8I8_9GAMM|nr:hypothetical protein [Natronospira sp. AB-CW4]MDQ2070339.1 hypothetical protein [Natronospira sp. AB-CW4]
MSHDLLIKFGAEKYMQRFLEQGELYMNTLASYRGNEHDSERHDPNEGLERILQMKGAKITRKCSDAGRGEEIARLTGGVGRIKNSNLDKINVYCMFHFVIPFDENVPLGEVVDERVWRGFGDTAVIIGDAADFVSRVKDEAHRRGLSHWRSSVEYVDMNKRHDEVGPFVKDLAYSHQHELRIAVFDEATNPGPLSLSLGSIADIACLVPASDVGRITVQSCANT